jgi:hypothetical protein
MPSRIVTYVHRPKRPPRKRQAVTLAGPAIVTQRATPTAAPRPANDDWKPNAEKSAIVTTTSRKLMTRHRVDEAR